jgi:hypothetical protein
MGKVAGFESFKIEGLASISLETLFAPHKLQKLSFAPIALLQLWHYAFRLIPYIP